MSSGLECQPVICLFSWPLFKDVNDDVNDNETPRETNVKRKKGHNHNRHCPDKDRNVSPALNRLLNSMKLDSVLRYQQMALVSIIELLNEFH